MIENMNRMTGNYIKNILAIIMEFFFKLIVSFEADCFKAHHSIEL